MIKLEKLARPMWTGMLFVIAAWATITLTVEFRLGMPHTREELGHRLIGWFVSLFLLRLFWRGFRRLSAANAL